MIRIGNDWDERLLDEWEQPYYAELRSFLIDEYRNGTVYPAADDIFNALRLTPYSEVKAVILGQDPYHEPGQAQGLAFSVPYDIIQPPSLVNILKELEDDKGWRRLPADDAADCRLASRSLIGDPSGAAGAGKTFSQTPEGVLVPWAKQGVLLLNTVLTVRAHQAGSHRSRGWEKFTDRVIELIAEREQPAVFILWGANAGAKRDLIIRAETLGGTAPRRHLIIQAPHPSPLSAYRGFFGGRYFSRTNYFLEDNDIAPIDWSI